jgi:Domain of unknown function (DUF5916)/Carbohydrate family 9 binding domain-like
VKILFIAPIRAFVAACLLFLASQPAGAQATGHGAVATMRAVRVTEAPRLDGHLDDAAWRDATPATSFVQRDPDEGKPPTERTELRVIYDAAALYVGVRLHDREADKIVRRLSRRDDRADADRFTIYLDPHHDHLTGAVFSVSAAGSLADSILFNDTWEDGSWDSVWDAVVSIDAQGWTAEMRIPFSQLRFPSSERDAWGINAERFIQRRNESAWLQLVPKKENGNASRMAHLTGITGISAPRQLEVLPYTMSRAEFVEPGAPGHPFNDGSRMFAGAGLDLKFGLTSNFTVSAAINPDFGQVEVDPAVVNLTAFETYYPEKRPFFIEGSQIFQNIGRSGANSFWGFNNSEPDLFYSRRIGRSPQGPVDAPFVDRPANSTILGAVKLTGKSRSGWNVGLVNAVTSRESARLSGEPGRDRAEIEPFTNYFVGRLQREVKRVGFGMLTTWVERDLREPALRDTLAERALVVGGDGHLFLDGKRDWVITGLFAGSRVEGSPAAIARVQQAPARYFQRPDAFRFNPDATSLSGWTGHLTLNRNSGTWITNAMLWGVSPGFESGDLGFTNRTGIHGAHAVLLWRKPEPDRFTRSRQFWAAKFWSWDSKRDLQSDGLFGVVSATFLNYWSLNAHTGYFRRGQDGWQTRGGPSMVAPQGHLVAVSLDSDSRRRLVLSLSGDYSKGEYGDSSHTVGASLEFKPTSSLQVSAGPQITRSYTTSQYVQTDEDPDALATFGSRYVFSDLDQTQVSMTTRATWVMSPRMSLQFYSQPLLATGDYWNFKALAAPRTFDFTPIGGVPENPDFNFKSLKVNAVFRWEWRLGSTLYVVWTDQREDLRNPGHFRLGRDARHLFGAPADDVLMVKVSYWLSR